MAGCHGVEDIDSESRHGRSTVTVKYKRGTEHGLRQAGAFRAAGRRAPHPAAPGPAALHPPLRAGGTAGRGVLHREPGLVPVHERSPGPGRDLAGAPLPGHRRRGGRRAARRRPAPGQGAAGPGADGALRPDRRPGGRAPGRPGRHRARRPGADQRPRADGVGAGGREAGPAAPHGAGHGRRPAGHPGPGGPGGAGLRGHRLLQPHQRRERGHPGGHQAQRPELHRRQPAAAVANCPASRPRPPSPSTSRWTRTRAGTWRTSCASW